MCKKSLHTDKVKFKLWNQHLALDKVTTSWVFICKNVIVWGNNNKEESEWNNIGLNNLY